LSRKKLQGKNEAQLTMSDAMIFLRMFLRYPAMLGSVWPSSGSLCSRLMTLADWSNTRYVVEYGPGVGTITRHILQNLRRDGTLIAIEKNPKFVEHLRERFAYEDHRLKIVEGSAADVREILNDHGIAAADCIVSGIPFSLIPRREVQRIMAGTRQSLSRQGKLLVYQFTSAIETDLRSNFQLEHSGREIWNFLPARTYVASRVDRELFPPELV
jgi:phospholipid N-methyltransferase